MSKPKGKTPSLIGSSLGRVEIAMARKKCACSRCEAQISMGEKCFDVQQPRKQFSPTRRFCADCFTKVLEETEAVLGELKAQVLV